MGRLEKFKQERNLRQRTVLVVLLFCFILCTGILTVDKATHYYLTGKQGLALFELNNRGNSLEIIVMNRKIYINTAYIKRDLNKLKRKLQSFHATHS